jgi:glyoxylase-like metal-dependent hydrolase (beta-lactamase superfamily II)
MEPPPALHLPGGKAGNFSCLAVSDGSYDYPPEALFANAAAETVRQELNRIGATTPLVTTPYTFLLAETGRQRVLVDLGAGPLASTTGKLAANLAAAGYRPDEIDCVVITHAHPDHIAGARDEKEALPPLALLHLASRMGLLVLRRGREGGMAAH